MKVLRGRMASAALVAVVGVLAAGGGYALASGGGVIHACVHSGTKALYLGKCAKHDSRISWNAKGPQGATGATGATGAAGAQGGPGTAGAPGTAKAYGDITEGGTLVTALSKNVTSVTNPAGGIFCVTVAGASSSTEGAVATPNFDSDTTEVNNIAHVEWVSSGGSCNAGQFEFLTSEVTASTTLSNTDLNQGFFFVIP